MYRIWFKQANHVEFFDLSEFVDYIENWVGYEINDITRIEKL